MQQNIIYKEKIMKTIHLEESDVVYSDVLAMYTKLKTCTYTRSPLDSCRRTGLAI